MECLLALLQSFEQTLNDILTAPQADKRYGQPVQEGARGRKKEREETA
jgi:hypothetical protein